MTLLVLLVLLVALCGLTFTYYTDKRARNDLTYVYPKTKHRYLVIRKCKIKSPETGEWHDAFYYRGLDDGKYYAREKNDFASKFVLLKDWENGNKDK